MTGHKDQPNILEGLTYHKYFGFDASTKETCLLDGTKTDSLGAVKANIIQNSKLCRDFERFITFYKEFI